MYLSILASCLLPSLVFANSLNTELENVAEFQSWYSLIKPYKDVIINLHQNERVTILIPSPAAVSEFTTSDRFRQDSESIRQLLLYHVIKGEHKSKDIVAAGPFLETYLQQDGLTGGQKVQVARGVQTSASELEQVVFYSGMGQNASLSSNHDGRDFDANGTPLQLIDSVLTIPLSMSETALNAGLTSFAGAITTANFDVDAVSDATFFAPTNDAFETVGSALNSASDSDLQNILRYHYINSSNSNSPLYTSRIRSASQQTADGNDVTFSYGSGTDLFVNSAAVTYANLLVQNGVVQIIDQVLNPDSNSSTTPAGSVGLPAFPEATRTDSPPFADAVSGAQTGGESLGMGPIETPLGPLSDDYRQQREQIESSGAGAVKTTAIVVVGIALVFAIMLVW